MFKVGNSYTKHDIYRILDVPSERQKGAWDTGYRKYDDAFYVFANIDTAGRTGHDYDNHWEGENLIWYAKTGTTIHQPIIQELLSNTSTVNIFTRTNDRSPFTYQGVGKVQSYEDVIPVKITWKLNNPYIVDIKAAWNTLIKNAQYFYSTGESFYSPKNYNEYKIVDVDFDFILIRRLSIDSQTQEKLTFQIFQTAIERLNTTSGYIHKTGMYDRVAFESTIVWLLPMLDWDNDLKNIIVIENIVEEPESIYITEAANDSDFRLIERQIRLRRGQNKLRENLFKLYNQQCCISQYNTREVLHACHIMPHTLEGNNSSTNALLLRADIHDLFDSNLLGIHPETLAVNLKSDLLNSKYQHLQGVQLLKRTDGKLPDKRSLIQRWKSFNS
jgi:hypothetical protein